MESYTGDDKSKTPDAGDHRSNGKLACANGDGAHGQPAKPRLPPGGSPVSEFDDRPPDTIKLTANRYGDIQPPRQRRIDASNEDLPSLAKEAWRAIQEGNKPPTFFRYGAIPCRIEYDDHGTPMLRTMTQDRMRHRLARDASWFVRVRKKEKPIAPPTVVVKDILAAPDPDLPVLSRIVEAPVFAMDGSLCTDPGYNPSNKTFFAPAPGLHIPNVSMLPTAAEIQEARELLTVELIGQFPFVGDPKEIANAEKAHAVSTALEPFARDMIEGPTPLHSFEAPSPGTGKTLLAILLTIPALARSATAMTEGRNEEEWRKRIFAKLRSAPCVLFLDNLQHRLESGALSSAITSYPMWEDRVLGVSDIVRVPIQCTWIATGNNPTFSSEMTRRTIRIRLDAKIDRPWLREGPRPGQRFRHADITGWAKENRSRLIWACLTLIQAWIVGGRPEGTRTLGMFEQWSKVMGGILDYVGIPGFLQNLSDFYEKSDAEGAAWRAFIATWWNDKKWTSVTAAELCISATNSGIDLGDKGEQSQKIRLGKLLRSKLESVFTVKITESEEITLRIETDGKDHQATKWKLSPQTGESGGESGGESEKTTTLFRN